LGGQRFLALDPGHDLAGKPLEIAGRRYFVTLEGQQTTDVFEFFG
jgi:hypothetical protein